MHTLCISLTSRFCTQSFTSLIALLTHTGPLSTLMLSKVLSFLVGFMLKVTTICAI